MHKFSRYLTRQLSKSNTQSLTNKYAPMMRQFSIQQEMEKFDFTETVNNKELKLKNPEKTEKMNLCAAVCNA